MPSAPSQLTQEFLHLLTNADHFIRHSLCAIQYDLQKFCKRIVVTTLKDFFCGIRIVDIWPDVVDSNYERYLPIWRRNREEMSSVVPKTSEPVPKNETTEVDFGFASLHLTRSFSRQTSNIIHLRSLDCHFRKSRAMKCMWYWIEFIYCLYYESWSSNLIAGHTRGSIIRKDHKTIAVSWWNPIFTRDYCHPS